jgi:hypothetical protein
LDKIFGDIIRLPTTAGETYEKLPNEDRFVNLVIFETSQPSEPPQEVPPGPSQSSAPPTIRPPEIENPSKSTTNDSSE